MHVGAPGSGAPRGNKNALKHGIYAREAIEERRQLRALLSCPSSLADKGPEAAARASSSNRLV